MLPLPPPEPLALLLAAAEDSVTAGLASLPQDLRSNSTRHVVMLRGRRRVFLLDNGRLRNAFPVAIGMPGWETPTGRFEVLQKIPNPVWVHPVSGDRVEEQGVNNPLGTPHRWTVGRAVSHGCVRLYNEDVRALYRQVSLGTQVTVLP